MKTKTRTLCGWHLSTPQRTAVTLDGLVERAAEEGVFKRVFKRMFRDDRQAGQLMLAAAARSEMVADVVRVHCGSLFGVDRDFIRLAATVSELTHSQPAHIHAICTAMARGVPAPQAVETVKRVLWWR